MEFIDDRVNGSLADSRLPTRKSTTASAAAWPLTTALSIVAGRPVSIQSPARNSPGTAVSSPAAAAGPARPRTSRASRARRRRGAARRSRTTATPPSTRAARGRPAPGCSGRRSPSAPLDTSERCELASPKSARLSNTHCIARPGRPTKVRRRHRAIEPEIDGHDRRRGRASPRPR